MTDNVIEIKNLTKSFGKHEVLKGVDFAVKKGEVVSVIGASGSGKSTMLRCINLLETPTSGEIYYHGEDILGKNFNVQSYRVKVGMVFQQFNLFNNMNVLDNCVIGQVKVLKRSKEAAIEKARYFLDKVGMGQYGSSVATFGRSETKGRYCEGAFHGSRSSSFRRADIGSRSRNGGRSSARNERPCEIGTYDDCRYS